MDEVRNIQPGNRYLLFAYYAYYPEGGMHDCICSFNYIEDLNIDEIKSYHYLQILVMNTMEFITIKLGKVENCGVLLNEINQCLERMNVNE